LSDRITPLVQRQTGEEEEEELLQTKSAAGNTPEVAPSLAAEINAMQGGGQPLPVSERAFFEPRFGYDFSQVRIHTSSQAAEAARAVNAQAFTVGRDVVFGAGHYIPAGASGWGLLAHELTHVVQQAASGKPNPKASEFLLQRSEGDPVEKGSAREGETLILYAGGFNQFENDSKEAEFLHSPDRKYWNPGTKDFRQTATDTQTADIYPINNVNEFFTRLEMGNGSIGRIVYIGHGASGALGFSPSGENLNAESLSQWEVNIDRNIRPKLTESAIIDLYSCEAGRDEGIMNALAAAFGVCVRGFAMDIEWCIHSPQDSSVITSRGRWIDGSVDATDSSCDSPGWNKGVASALPPVKVCPK